MIILKNYPHVTLMYYFYIVDKETCVLHKNALEKYKKIKVLKNTQQILI